MRKSDGRRNRNRRRDSFIRLIIRLRVKKSWIAGVFNLTVKRIEQIAKEGEEEEEGTYILKFHDGKIRQMTGKPSVLKKLDIESMEPVSGKGK